MSVTLEWQDNRRSNAEFLATEGRNELAVLGRSLRRSVEPKNSHQICIHEFSQPGFTGHEMETPASMALIQVCAI
jgi:hypothetical protein